MPSLYDYEPKYLSEGRHVVFIASVKMITFNTGNRGLEVVFNDQNGAAVKARFTITEKALFRLGMLAKAAGLTIEERKAYDPYNEQHHECLVGRWLMIDVENNDNGYAEATGFHAYTTQETTAAQPAAPPPPPTTAQRMAAPPAPPAAASAAFQRPAAPAYAGATKTGESANNFDSNDDIPF